jgi:hypothetical protein
MSRQHKSSSSDNKANDDAESDAESEDDKKWKWISSGATRAALLFDACQLICGALRVVCKSHF